jgi:hypothetical protein
MSGDRDLENDYMDRVEDRFTAAELVEELGLETQDIIDAFWEIILEKRPVK